MTASPTSIVGVFAGEIAYKDGSKGAFCANLEVNRGVSNPGNTGVWKLADGTLVTAAQCAADVNNASGGGNIANIIGQLPFFTVASVVTATGTNKVVADFWMRLSVTLTFSDGTTVPFGVSLQKVGATRQYVFDNNSASGYPLSSTPNASGQYVAKSINATFLNYFKQLVAQVTTVVPGLTAT